MNAPLSRKKKPGVLLTRPLVEATLLAEKVKRLGAIAYVFPTLEIDFSAKPNIDFTALKGDEIIVFTSHHAVQGALVGMGVNSLAGLSRHTVAAVGERTQAALLANGIHAQIMPEAEQQNSEGLLAHSALQYLQDKQVLIFRGQSGRDALRDGLQIRGAKVQYVQSYQRNIPKEYTPAPITAALEAGDIQVLMLTSFATFRHLIDMLGDGAYALIKDKTLLVASARIARRINEDMKQHCKAARESEIIIAENASDEAMMNAWETWKSA